MTDSTRPSLHSALPASPNQAHNLALLRSWSSRHGCLDAVACDECIGHVAKSLALGFEYSLDQARLMAPAEYQAELGVEICDLERARELKWMTTRACYTTPDGEPSGNPGREHIPDPGAAMWAQSQIRVDLHASSASVEAVGVWQRVREWLGAHPFEFGVLWTLAILALAFMALRGGRLWH